MSHHKPGHVPLRPLISLFYQNMGPARRLLLPDMGLLVLDALFQAAVPAVLAIVVDRITTDPQAFVAGELPRMVGLTVVGSVVFYIVAASQHYIGQHIAAETLVNTQARLYHHLQRLSADFFQRTHVGEITSRLTNDTVNGVQELFLQIHNLFWVFMLLVSSLVMMAVLHPGMLGVFVAVLTVFGFLSRMVMPVLRRLHREARDELGKVNARITEDMTSISLVQAFAVEDMRYEELRQQCGQFLSKTLRSRRVGVLFGDLINTFLVLIGPLALLYIGATVISKEFSVAKLVAFFMYWRVAGVPAANMIRQIATLFASFASLDRIYEFFQISPSISDVKNARAVSLRGRVEFLDVTFTYPSAPGEVVLDRVSFSVDREKSLAVVGESGAGKSTIVALLLRFYAASQGRVLVDGNDVMEVRQESLRQQIGLVMQDTVVLSGTIRGNMLLARPEATDDRIIEALKCAEAWSFISEFPDGLDTVLGERGVRLSGGQRQRIAIARVFLKDPPIVVLDEATSALDSITEKKIQETMRQLFMGRTSITIAHRLSTVIHCDSILMLHRGTVIGMGPHEELLQTCPSYRHLCTRQHLSIPEPGRNGVVALG